VVSSASSLSSAPISSASSSAMSSASSLLISSVSSSSISSISSSSVTLSSSSASSLPNTGETKWTSIKFGGGGYVTGLIYHPTTANLLYARTDIGGAYRWNQASSAWIPITDGIGFGGGEGNYHGIESIALDPNNDQLVYMAAGRDTTGNGRLYISSDRGDNWTYVALPFGIAGNNSGRSHGERLAVDPNMPSTLFYGSRVAGLWKSVDSGRNWAQVSSLSSFTATSATHGVTVVLFDTNTKGSGTATQTLYAAISPDYVSAAGLTSSLYKSTNGGASWTAIWTPVTGYYIPHMVRASDGMLYVGFTKSAGPGDGGPGYLYKFDGSNWTQLRNINFAGFGGVSVSGSGPTTRIALAVSGTFGEYSGKQVVQLSDNAGLTWHEIEANGITDSGWSGWADDVEIDPSNRDHILRIHGGGVVETRNASASMPTWNTAVDGLEETGVEDIVTPPPGAPYTVITSAGDVGAWVYTDLTQTPTRGPDNRWNNGFGSDMAWSDPLYIASIGSANWNGHAATGYWSGDGGNTWASFATLAPGAAEHPDFEASVAVTSRNNVIWAPSQAAPSYTTNNGASWVSTNLPALGNLNGINRAYHLVADRQNPNKVYAYDSGGHWWGSAGKVYVSTNGGHSFTQSQGAVSANLKPAFFRDTSFEANPNVEGDLWLADSNALYHSVDSGATWTKTGNFASVYTSNPWPDVYGATQVALGKAKDGAPYSVAVYVVGVLDGVWGVWRSDDAGATWARVNDDQHQFGSINKIAADHNVYGRVYVAGMGRGALYNN
jgi:xyloglucan-specific exo-beta-1,4-glucanase